MAGSSKPNDDGPDQQASIIFGVAIVRDRRIGGIDRRLLGRLRIVSLRRGIAIWLLGIRGRFYIGFCLGCILNGVGLFPQVIRARRAEFYAFRQWAATFWTILHVLFLLLKI